MSHDVGHDQLAVIHIEGMHCHRCQQTIQKLLQKNPGVHEVEVDFPSRQVSVLFDRETITIGKLMDAINQAGYHATGFTQGQADRAQPS